MTKIKVKNRVVGFDGDETARIIRELVTNKHLDADPKDTTAVWESADALTSGRQDRP